MTGSASHAGSTFSPSSSHPVMTAQSVNTNSNLMVIISPPQPQVRDTGATVLRSWFSRHALILTL
jgi:hypothetical protein